MLSYHQEHFFGAYDAIIIDYNFAPGDTYQSERWQGIIEKTLPAIALTNLLSRNGKIWVPKWNLVKEAANESVLCWFNLKCLDDPKDHPLHIATLAAQELHNFVLEAPKGYYLFSLNKSNEPSDAICELDKLIKRKESPNRNPRVISGLDRMRDRVRGLSTRYPIIVDDETGPLHGLYATLKSKNKNSLRFTGRIDAAGIFFYETQSLEWE